MNKLVWTIAGSDASGGAGITADVKAMQSFGIHGCTVITALTAQNSMGIEEINAVSVDVIKSQLDVLEQDMPAAVIKIGMLANVKQIEFIAQKIQSYKNNWPIKPKIVYDPVMVASTGENLTEDDVLPAIKEHLLPLVDILTPNTRETQTLTGVYLIGPGAVRDAARSFFKMGVDTVIIKGGHWDYPKGYCIDYCMSSDENGEFGSAVEEYWLGNKTIKTPHNHGTGCSFASSIAACIAKQYPIKDAFILAKAYINQGLKVSQRFAQGIGPVAHCGFPDELADFPEVIEADSFLGLELDLDPVTLNPPASGFASCDVKALGLYAVVDSVEWIKLCLENGISTIQFRIKDNKDPLLESKIKNAIVLGKEYNARLFINDHWQLALKHNAYGVHLGQEDLYKADLVAIKSAGLRLGLSTHGFYEMLKAHNFKPSYLAFGAIYPTTTKDMTGQIQGLEKLNHFVPLMQEYPTVAIGGIDLSRIQEVADTQVGSIAVVRAITEAEDPSLAIKKLQSFCGE